MAQMMTKQYNVTATSPKYGDANLTITLEFDNEHNTSKLFVSEGFVMGGQTSGYTAAGAALATSKTENNCIRLYSLKALTKLGTNHIYLYRADEENFNKQTRYICDLTMMSITIKQDIYKWRKLLNNEEE